MAINAQMSPIQAVPLAKAALQRALTLDPNLAQAHATLGLLESQCEWNWHEAAQEFHKAIDLQPNYAPAHHWAALNQMQLGQFAVADAEFRKAQVLDPLSPMISEGLAENFYDARRYDEAINTVLNMQNPRIGWVILADSYLLKGMYREALKIPEIANPVDLDGFLLKGEALARSGERQAGLKILEDLEHNRLNPGTDHDYISPGYLGWGYAMAGDKEQAFTWLEKAYRQHDPALANLKVDPGFDILRSDPRYLDLLKRVGLND
jgi:tetratricopeptide (TPR) repeat protein